MIDPELAAEALRLIDRLDARFQAITTQLEVDESLSVDTVDELCTEQNRLIADCESIRQEFNL